MSVFAVAPVAVVVSVVGSNCNDDYFRMCFAVEVVGIDCFVGFGDFAVADAVGEMVIVDDIVAAVIVGNVADLTVSLVCSWSRKAGWW